MKGFALTLLIGVLVSMISAISITRTFLFALEPKPLKKGSGKDFIQLGSEVNGKM